MLKLELKFALSEDAMNLCAPLKLKVGVALIEHGKVTLKSATLALRAIPPNP